MKVAKTSEPIAAKEIADLAKITKSEGKSSAKISNLENLYKIATKSTAWTFRSIINFHRKMGKNAISALFLGLRDRIFRKTFTLNMAIKLSDNFLEMTKSMILKGDAITDEILFNYAKMADEITCLVEKHSPKLAAKAKKYGAIFSSLAWRPSLLSDALFRKNLEEKWPEISKPIERPLTTGQSAVTEFIIQEIQAADLAEKASNDERRWEGFQVNPEGNGNYHHAEEKCDEEIRQQFAMGENGDQMAENEQILRMAPEKDPEWKTSTAGKGELGRKKKQSNGFENGAVDFANLAKNLEEDLVNLEKLGKDSQK